MLRGELQDLEDGKAEVDVVEVRSSVIVAVRVKPEIVTTEEPLVVPFDGKGGIVSVGPAVGSDNPGDHDDNPETVIVS